MRDTRTAIAASGSVLALWALTSALVAQPAAPNAVLTHHNGAARRGVNAGERSLMPTNLGTLHRIGGFRVDGQVYAQPLFVPNVQIDGRSRRGPSDLTIVKTVHAV